MSETIEGDIERYGGPGRPTKLTPEMEKRFLDAIRSGATAKAASEFAGITERTLYYWLERAEEPDAPEEFIHFFQSVRRARAELQVRAVAFVMKKIAGGADRTVTRKTLADGSVEETVTERTVWPDGKLALDLLERAFPEDFGRRGALEVSGPGGRPVELAVSPDRLIALAERVKAAMADPENVIDTDTTEPEWDT